MLGVNPFERNEDLLPFCQDSARGQPPSFRMPPRRPLVRIEQGPNNTLSLATVAAELSKKSKPKHFSAFSFQAFSTSSFLEVMAQDGVLAPHEAAATSGAEVIDHAINQITTRTTLVTQMATEMRKETSAVLAAAHVEMGSSSQVHLAPARKRTTEDAEALPMSQSEQEAERAAVDALATSWRASLERLQRVAQGVEEGKVALRLERLCPKADEVSGPRPRLQPSKQRAQRHALAASASGLAPPRDAAVGGMGALFLRWEADWEAGSHDAGGSGDAERASTESASSREEEACGGPSWALWRAGNLDAETEAELAREIASLPASDDDSGLQSPAICALPPGRSAPLNYSATRPALDAHSAHPTAAAASQLAAGALPPGAGPPPPSSPPPRVPPPAMESAGCGEGADWDGGASVCGDTGDWPMAPAADAASGEETASPMELEHPPQMPETPGGAQPDVYAAATVEAGAEVARGVDGSADPDGVRTEDEFSDCDDFEDQRTSAVVARRHSNGGVPSLPLLGGGPSPRTSHPHQPPMRRRVVVSDSEDDEPGQAPPGAQEATPVRRLAPATLSDDSNLASGDRCDSSGGNGRSCSGSADPGGGIGSSYGVGSDVGGAEGADLGDCLDDDALAAALDQAEATRGPRSAAHMPAPAPVAPPATTAAVGVGLLVDLLAPEPTTVSGGSGGGRGKAAAKQAGTKSRPFALKRSAQDNLLTLGAAPPVRPKQAAQRHSLAECLVAGPQGDLSFALPAAAAEIKDRGAMFRSWLSRDGDALAWMELRHCTKRWNQSVPLTPAEGSPEEQADTESGETGPDGATADGDECAWDGTGAWEGAEAWGAREWGSNNAWRGADGAAPHGCNDAQGSGDADVTEGAQLGACPVRAEEEEDEVIEVVESEASWGADGDVGDGVPSDSEGDAHSRGMPLVDEPLARPPLHGMPRSPRGDEDAPPVRPLVPGPTAKRTSPLEPPAVLLPSRRASLPQLGSFVARCIAGGAVKLSDVLRAAGSSTVSAASGAPVPADAPPSAQRVLALVANVACSGSRGEGLVPLLLVFSRALAHPLATLYHPRCSSRCCGSRRSTTQGNTHDPPQFVTRPLSCPCVAAPRSLDPDEQAPRLPFPSGKALRLLPMSCGDVEIRLEEA